ncbi:MAG: aquaporin, partial [Eggerthellaceae bacterium]|nr:aquaporin [Eggerthellaceae bacterium]
CHINPAVSLGVFLDKRMSGKDLIGYWVSQFIGGIVGAALLLAIISLSTADVATVGLGANGFDSASFVGLNAGGAIIVEVVLTAVFVLTILGVTANEKTAPFAGLVIGLTLAFVHILGIALTGTSVNPARSFGPALLLATQGETTALSQVWVFIVAPLVGAALAAGIFSFLKIKK